MNRDIIIDEKLVFLKNKKAELEETLASLPSYVTNMQVNVNGTICNLRTITSIENLRNAFRAIHQAHAADEQFNSVILDKLTTTDLEQTPISGYMWDNWVTDFKTIATKITVGDALKKTDEAIREIEKFYSGDRKEENAFNDLLGKIDLLGK